MIKPYIGYLPLQRFISIVLIVLTSRYRFIVGISITLLSDLNSATIETENMLINSAISLLGWWIGWNNFEQYWQLVCTSRLPECRDR